MHYFFMLYEMLVTLNSWFF